MKLSIIVATHQFNQLFKNSVKSIVKNTQLPTKDYEVIIAANGLEFAVAAQLQAWLKTKSARLIQLQKANPNQARNIAAIAAQGQYLAFLDNDIRASAGWSKSVLRYLEQNPQVAGGQLKLIKLGSNQYDSAGELFSKNGFLIERARGAKDEGQFDQADLIFSGKLAAVIIRKSVFEEIGGLDPVYGYYWEEPDLFWRACKAGHEARFLWMGKIEHAFGTPLKPGSKDVSPHIVFNGYRNHIITLYKNAIGLSLLRQLIAVNLSWLVLELLFLFRGKFRQVIAIKQARFWLFTHLRLLRQKRSWVQKNLPSDDGWMRKITIKQDFKWHLGKSLAYILGKGF